MENPQKLKNFMLWEEIKPHIGKKLDLTDFQTRIIVTARSKPQDIKECIYVIS